MPIRLLPAALLFTVIAAGAFSAPVRGHAATSRTATSMPNASTLLLQAAKANKSKGTVVETGKITSSDNSVIDGRTLWQEFSWKHHTYRNHTFFRRPTNLSSQIRHVRDIKRVIVDRHIDIHAHKRWYCGRATAHQNAGYWQSPKFTLSSPKTVGEQKINGTPTWHVRGNFKTNANGVKTKLTVNVFIAQSTHLYVRVRDTGTVKNTNTEGGARASISGQLDYSDFGKKLSIHQPLDCKS
jgi:hypothetical protein